MANEDVDDIFKDFENKVDEKKEIPEIKKEPETKVSDGETLKRKYEKAEQVLKHKYKKEKEALEEKNKETPAHFGDVPHKNTSNIERVAYVAIILVLVVYAGIDLLFYHGNQDVVVEEPTITAAAVTNEEANATEEVVEATVEEEETTEEVVEKKVLSGKITLTIDEVFAEVSDTDDRLGYINKVVFTIDNGKTESLSPIVNVFIYDNTLHESWETRSRGKYTGTAIKSGETQSGSIGISPKSFRSLNIKKNIRVKLEDAEGNFIVAVNDLVEIG